MTGKKKSNVIEANLTVLDTYAEMYYNAKNGYMKDIRGGRNGDFVYGTEWCDPSPVEAADRKQKLIQLFNELEKEYGNDLLKDMRGSVRFSHTELREFLEELEKERKLNEELAKGVLLDNEHVDLKQKLHLEDIFEKHPGYSTPVERNPEVKGAYRNGNFTGDIIWDGGEDCTLDTKRKSDLREQKFHYEDGVLTEIKQSREATRAHRWHTMTGSYEKDLETYSYTATLQPDGKFFIKENNSSWFEKDGKKDGNSEEHRSDGMIIKAQYKEGQLHGVYKELDANGTLKVEKYYENGVDITEKRKILQRIADSKIRKENNLKQKNLPKALEELGKAQIKFNSKIEAAVAIKKAQKEGRK